MAEEELKLTDNGRNLFDKFTGKKYLCLSATELSGIKHYRLKSEETEDIL